MYLLNLLRLRMGGYPVDLQVFFCSFCRCPKICHDERGSLNPSKPRCPESYSLLPVHSVCGQLVQGPRLAGHPRQNSTSCLLLSPSEGLSICEDRCLYSCVRMFEHITLIIGPEVRLVLQALQEISRMVFVHGKSSHGSAIFEFRCF